MFEITLFELVAFGRQVAGACMGAFGLHGWLLFNRQHGKLSRLLERPMVAAAVAYLAAWGIGFVGYTFADAHVGISLIPSADDILRSFSYQTPLVIMLIVLLATSRQGFKRAPRLYHLLYFVVASMLISTYAVSDHIDKNQVSYVLHGWHSILTIGTVVTLDYFFFVCRNNRAMLARLNKSFGRFTLFIFIGLALDLFSTYFIFREAFVLDTRFFFMQTVVGILLLNGVLLSGPLTRHAAQYLSHQRDLPKPLHTMLGFMGVISLVSWTTITFLDFVPKISLSYGALFSIYVVLIGGGFLSHLVIDGWPLKKRPLVR